MSKVIRCDSCHGRKQIVGLGNMIKDCPSCRGIGFIENIDKKLKSVLGDQLNNSTVKRKPGRKPKEEVTNV